MDEADNHYQAMLQISHYADENELSDNVVEKLSYQIRQKVTTNSKEDIN